MEMPSNMKERYVNMSVRDILGGINASIHLEIEVEVLTFLLLRSYLPFYSKL